ncbi:MAG TPA: 3',5'-cyclic-nucleotide phosphodiesterase [Gammaproteobacteria bacterium]|jgi:ribonuclease BN (tRNA processing enzyme)|nr:3',5'-cyclic-nucleotide phosphodiesterase [Gammaproteobacteria bacterium]
MGIRILGCSGGIGAVLRTTSLLLDNETLIDAGTGIGDLTLDEMRRIRHVFFTHSHLDHTCGLPLLVDTIFDTLKMPLTVYGRPETLDAVRKHIFNWVMWPDFGELPAKHSPVLTYKPLNPGDRIEVAGRKLHMVEVDHTVPGAGYIIERDGKVFAFSGDTYTNDTFWAAVNSYPKIDALMVEAAFANSNRKLADMAKHYCPETLAADLKKLKHDCPIYITHLKPGGEDVIFDEIRAALPQRKVTRLKGGEVFDL